MSNPSSDSVSLNQDNTVKDIQFSGDHAVFTFSPVQIDTQIETQIVQISVEKVTQRELNKESPYKGLKRFNSTDRDRFFGRDKLIAQLFEAVNRSSLTLVLGASGSGKSSVVRAGLIPELRKSLAPEAFYDFIFTPNQDPFESLYRCLLNEEKDYSFTALQAQIALEAKSNTLAQIVSKLKAGNDRWLFFIDQFEELFTRCTNLERCKHFINSIVQLVQSGDSSVRFVLAMRSDFLEQLGAYPSLVAIANQNNIHVVADMYPDQLRQAIEQPAAKHGIIFEEGLVEQIIKDVEGQSGYLPLLQYVLDLLWDNGCKSIGANGHPKIESRVLTRDDYNALEGVRGALQTRVDDIYKNLNQDEQITAKQIFLKLVNIVETDLGNKAVSRRAYRSEFVGYIVEETLRKFINENLLVSSYEQINLEHLQIQRESDRESHATIEVAHEIILSSWELLKRWLEEEKEAIILKNWLASETRRWQKINAADPIKAKDELLKGSRLEQITTLRKKEAFARLGGLGAVEDEFINASLQERDRQRLEAETRRQQKLKLYRNVAIGASLSLIGFALLGSIAAWNWRRAGRGQIEALIASADAKFQANRYSLDTLIAAIQTGEQFQNSLWKNPDLEADVLRVLSQATYWVREQNRLQGHTGIVQSVAFSPDEQVVATASFDNTAKLWSLTGEELETFEGHSDPVTSVSFSPDGSLIGTGSFDKTARLWQRDGTHFHTLTEHTDKVWSISFSPDGQLIATGSANETVKLWNAEGQFIQTLEPQQVIHSISFSHNSKEIATANDNGTVTFWNHKGTPLRSFLGHNKLVFQVNFSPDDQIFVTASGDYTAKLWFLNRNTDPIVLKGHKDSVTSAVFSSDSQLIATASYDRTIRIWNQQGKELYTLTGHDGRVNSVSFSPDKDSHLLASASNDQTVKLWQLRSPWLSTLNAHTDSVRGVSFSPDGQTLATVGYDNKVHVWSESGELLHVLQGNDNFNDVSISPDGQIIAAAGDDDKTRLWRIDGTPLKTLEGHSNNVSSVSFSPDNQTLATASNDGTVRLWHRDGRSLITLKGHDDTVYDVNFSSDGETLITAGDDGTVRLWHRNGEERAVLQTLTRSGTWRAIFSPNDQLIAASSEDGTVSLWQRDGRFIGQFQGHRAGVSGISFSPDNQLIATGSDDATVKLWRVKDQTLITTLAGHKEAVNSISFSPDGNLLATVSSDDTVLLWKETDDLTVSHLLNRGCLWLNDYLKSNLRHQENNASSKVDICGY